MSNLNMLKALNSGFPNATDLADYLVKELNIPFREAHHITGTIVKMAEDKGLALEELSLKDMQKVCKNIKQNVFEFIKMENSLNSRKSYGGTAPVRVKEAIKEAKKLIKNI